MTTMTGVVERITILNEDNSMKVVILLQGQKAMTTADIDIIDKGEKYQLLCTHVGDTVSYNKEEATWGHNAKISHFENKTMSERNLWV